MTPEGQVKKQGREICKTLGLYFFPVNQGSFGSTGIPDDMVCAWGLFLQIEYKAHMRWDKRHATAFATLPTDRQVLQMERARACGGVTWVVDDSNIHALKVALTQIRECRYGQSLGINPSDVGLSTITTVAQNTILNWDISYKAFAAYKAGYGDIQFLTSEHTIPQIVNWEK